MTPSRLSLQAYQKATGFEHVSNIVQQKPDAFVYTKAYAGSGQTSSGFDPFFGNDQGEIIGFTHSHPDLSTFSYILGSGGSISGDWVMGRILGNMNIYLAAPDGNTYVMPAEWFSSPRPPPETLVTVRDKDGNYLGTDIQGRLVQ